MVRVHPGPPFSCPCSPMQRQPPQKRSSAGASPAMGTIYAPVAQPTERRASNAEVEGASLSGNTISSRNANRTSVPGLFAKEIVPPQRGMRSMSSTFRHFQKTLSSNWPRHPTFYRITAGSNPARVAIFHAHVVQQQRHDVESVASAGASPAVNTIFRM